MALWIPVTIAAALVQTLRFMLQKQLKSAGLSTGGAAFSRFVFGAPLAIAVSAAALITTSADMPDLTAEFWMYALFGGLCQIVATHLTVALLSMRNFAVGVAFTKTETVQVALFSIVLLGERIAFLGWIAILVGLIGVGLLSTRAAGGAIISRTTVFGLLAGGLFGLSVISFRGATLALGDAPAAVRAFITLACVTSAQTVAMGLWMRLFEAGELTRVFATWRRTVLVGITGTLGSLFWFFAFALQNAAYVRALGQIEMVFTLLISFFVFRERLTGREVAGMAFICTSILLLVLTL
ncbi:EamA family transporter [Paracoccus marcusii]|uniref:EamA family transporter n=1 Tax=Paracoccus marcusii TaxID=59779 RepID=UPI0035A6E694